MCREMQVQIECARKKINILLKKCECNNKIQYYRFYFEGWVHRIDEQNWLRNECVLLIQ